MSTLLYSMVAIKRFIRKDCLSKIVFGVVVDKVLSDSLNDFSSLLFYYNTLESMISKQKYLDDEEYCEKSMLLSITKTKILQYHPQNNSEIVGKFHFITHFLSDHISSGSVPNDRDLDLVLKSMILDCEKLYTENVG